LEGVELPSADPGGPAFANVIEEGAAERHQFVAVGSHPDPLAPDRLAEALISFYRNVDTPL
jgi:hypothetical protein